MITAHSIMTKTRTYMHVASNAGAPKNVESKDGGSFHVLPYVTYIRDNRLNMNEGHRSSFELDVCG